MAPLLREYIIWKTSIRERRIKQWLTLRRLCRLWAANRACEEKKNVGGMLEEHCEGHAGILKRHKATFGECLENMFRARRERESASVSVWSLLHAGGIYAPKSDSTPLSQSQILESPYLFSSHWINNNIQLWTKTLCVSPSVSRSPSCSDLSPSPRRLHCSLCLFLHFDSYLYLCFSPCLPVCNYSHSQRLAVSSPSMNCNVSSSLVCAAFLTHSWSRVSAKLVFFSNRICK